MATELQIKELRIMINQPEDAEPYTNEFLGQLIDAAGGDLRSVASSIWESKATRVAHLMDISEGGSSRKMSELYTRYMALADRFGSGEEPAPEASVRPRTRPAVRV